MTWFMWFITIYAGGLALLALLLALLDHHKRRREGRALVAETESFLADHHA